MRERVGVHDNVGKGVVRHRGHRGLQGHCRWHRAQQYLRAGSKVRPGIPVEAKQQAAKATGLHCGYCRGV